MKFSHRHGFDPDFKKGIRTREDAPPIFRQEFLAKVLSPITYVDNDIRFNNTNNCPLGIKSLHQDLSFITQIPMSDYDWDSWNCWEGLKRTLIDANWYQFYDCLESIAEELKKIEKGRSSTNPIPNQYNFDSFRNNLNG